jgi:ferritin
MIKKIILDAINNQIQKEIYSSNLYLSMSAYFQDANMNGFANWMRMQSSEEMTHAMKFFDYTLDRGERPIISQIPQPKSDWESAVDVFSDSYKHEQSISESINQLADLAIKEADHATHNFLQWFIQEQVEEEAQVSEILSRLKLAGDSPGGLFILDNEMLQRKSD